MNTQKAYSLQHQLMSKGKRCKNLKNEDLIKKTSKKCRALKVVYISTPMKVTTSASKFREIVQGLTGRESDVVRIMESCGGNDTWIIPDDDHQKEGVVSTTTTTTDDDGDRVLPLVVDHDQSSTLSSSSEELVVPSDDDHGIYLKGQDCNFGLFDHSSLFYDHFFQQLDVLGSY